jgi:hypothetical protein
LNIPGLTVGFQLGNRRRYPAVFLILSLALLIGGYYFGEWNLKGQWAIPVLGVAVGFTTFLFTQQLQETRLFSELFKEFNTRYNGLNGPLNKIVETADTGFNREDRQVLMDYFNLCAEEYLYFRAGYLDKAVWSAWVRGMKFYADVPGIRRIWEMEIEGGSYYGFSLRELEKLCLPSL